METESTQLSYSSMAQLQTCEMQYAHRKIYKTPVDNPEVDNTAFHTGSATHQCVEFTNWGLKPLTQMIVDQAIVDYPDAADNKGLVHAMALKLIQQQKASGLICVKAEQQIVSQKFNGFIDLIAKYPSGDWYIVDLKTSAYKPNDGLIARLTFDRQLNLYASYSGMMAPLLDLDPDKFQGCIYRVVTKSKANPKSTENYKAFVQRLTKLTKVYDIIIPKDKLHIKEVSEMFEDAYVKSMCLRDGEIPSKNLGACFNYFRICDYFSHCYGCKSEEVISSIKMKSNDDYENELLDMEDL